MDTITMESLLITEDEWIATEGFGNAIKRGAGAIWEAIKALCGRIIQALRSLKEKVRKLFFRSKALKQKRVEVKAAQEGAVMMRDYCVPIFHFFQGLSSCAGEIYPIIHQMREIKTTMKTHPVTKNDETSILVRVDKLNAQLEEISKKYPPFDQMGMKNIPMEKASLQTVENILQICMKCLQNSEEEVAGVQHHIEGLDDANMEPPLLRLSTKIGALASHFISMNDRLSDYIEWQTNEVQRAMAKMQTLRQTNAQ